MKKLLVNPFKFGDPVEGDYYLSRPELSAAVTQFLEHRIHVVLIGPRRFGKTSFVTQLLKERELHATPHLFIDIFNITSHRDFLQQVLRALRLKKTWKDVIKEWMETIPRLRPKLTAEWDPVTAQTSYALSADLSMEKDVKEMIQDVLWGLNMLGNKVIIAIDEFQKITELNDQGWLEATLRTYMQQMSKTAFLFTGSRKSIIYDMLNNQSRPFYRSCQTIDFPSFGEEFTDWVMQRFESVGIQSERTAIQRLRILVQDTPNYVQMVCFHLVAQGTKFISTEKVETALRTIVRQNSYVYQTLLNSLTLMQQRALRLSAIEATQIFAKEFRAKYEISSGAALASTIKSLKEKQILDEGTARGEVVFDDPLFALWLQYSFSSH